MRTFSFIISLILGCTNVFAQDVPQKIYPDVYVLRIGTDLVKASRNFWDKNYTGFEINADYRYNKKWYIAAEAGFEDRFKEDDQLTYTTSGMFLKIGADKNFHQNWLDMDNLIYVGGRYGLSYHNQTLHSYRVNTGNAYFDEEMQYPNLKTTGLMAHWLELVVGIKAEVANNLYIGMNVRLKGLVYQTQPEGFENLYYPGFDQKYSGNIGVGFGYTVSYMIPFKKKF
ncbi:DUF6048 family protein [Paenimyroides viscosum]|uniref:DUF3575 domain-containing protein n=1 Tax=Paenimyroides viscosum TaxID=2488729 RepID=A0A3P1B7N5_9FLAO|nr:DUF6048 family protein [Paenimyroides viscosum]RRA96979.1 hypothetical protein EG242_00185 [Paenimyroides viscosum]